MYVSQSPAHALRPLGLLLADGVPTVGWGKTFWCIGRFFFYENGRNSETKSRKINLMMGNEPSLRGLQTGRWPILGSYGKIGFLDQKPRFWAQKKDSLLYSNHVLATTGKVVQRKKVPLPK